MGLEEWTNVQRDLTLDEVFALAVDRAGWAISSDILNLSVSDPVAATAVDWADAITLEAERIGERVALALVTALTKSGCDKQVIFSVVQAFEKELQEGHGSNTL